MTKNQSEKIVKKTGVHSVKDTIDKTHNSSMQQRKQQEIIELFGKLPADADYDYKRRRG